MSARIVIIAGSRTATEADVRIALGRCTWIDQATAIVSGTARGADTFGDRWAADRGLPVIRRPADWDRLGKRAGFARNEAMADESHGLVAVWDGESPGTRHMIEAARARGLRVFVWRYDELRVIEYEATGDIAKAWSEVDREALEEMFPAWDVVEPRVLADDIAVASDACVCVIADDCQPCAELAGDGVALERREAKKADRWLADIVSFEDTFPAATARDVSTHDQQGLGVPGAVLSGDTRDSLRERGWKISTSAELEERRNAPPPLAEREEAARVQSTSSKVSHVRRASQTRNHECHWPGCEAQVPPARWGCTQHWRALPKYLRDKIWDAYRIGQEVTLSPSREYLDVMREVDEWIKVHG